MTTVYNYSQLLGAMVGFPDTSQQVRWVLDGEFDADIGKILTKRMQNLEVSVKPTVTVPPVQSVPVQSPPATVTPAVQPPADVPVVQSSAVSSSAVEDPFKWTKKRVVDEVDRFLSFNKNKWLKGYDKARYEANTEKDGTVVFSDAHALIYTQPGDTPLYYYFVASVTGTGANIKYRFWIVRTDDEFTAPITKEDIKNAFDKWKADPDGVFSTLVYV